MKTRLAIIGASGHGKVIADIALLNGYKEIVFFDHDPSVKKCAGFDVVGRSNTVEAYKENYDIFIAIGKPKTRQKIQEKLETAGVSVVTLIHPKAVIGCDIKIGAGTVVMANAVINPSTNIGKGCIINTGCTVDHDNQIADYVHISVGAHLAGTVSIGEKTWIGAGAVVSNNVKITGNCIIGAGAVVVKDILEAGTYVGVPAQLK